MEKLREEVLRDFFRGKVTGLHLADVAAGSMQRHSDRVTVHQIQDMTEGFWITRPMLVSLCDSVLTGEFPAELLQSIGFALVASDKFHWDDDVIAGVIHDWAAPEINFPLTVENVANFKGWLSGSGSYPPHWGKF